MLFRLGTADSCPSPFPGPLRQTLLVNSDEGLGICCLVLLPLHYPRRDCRLAHADKFSLLHPLQHVRVIPRNTGNKILLPASAFRLLLPARPGRCMTTPWTVSPIPKGLDRPGKVLHMASALLPGAKFSGFAGFGHVLDTLHTKKGRA